MATPSMWEMVDPCEGVDGLYQSLTHKHALRGLFAPVWSRILAVELGKLGRRDL